MFSAATVEGDVENIGAGGGGVMLPPPQAANIIKLPMARTARRLEDGINYGSRTSRVRVRRESKTIRSYPDWQVSKRTRKSRDPVLGTVFGPWRSSTVRNQKPLSGPMTLIPTRFIALPESFPSPWAGSVPSSTQCLPAGSPTGVLPANVSSWHPRRQRRRSGRRGRRQSNLQ